jgi:hypothetical protein
MATTIDDLIASVAVLVDAPEQLRVRAQIVAEQLGIGSIPQLRLRLRKIPPAPPGFGPETRGLSGWIAIWLYAIFEILFHFRKAALPLLREVAFGEYDWTQANAIDILCRFAEAGIERRQIVGELCRNVPGMRFEAQYYAAPYLERLAEQEPRLMEMWRSQGTRYEWLEDKGEEGSMP